MILNVWFLLLVGITLTACSGSSLPTKSNTPSSGSLECRRYSSGSLLWLRCEFLQDLRRDATQQHDAELCRFTFQICDEEPSSPLCKDVPRTSCYRDYLAEKCEIDLWNGRIHALRQPGLELLESRDPIEREAALDWLKALESLRYTSSDVDILRREAETCMEDIRSSK